MEVLVDPPYVPDGRIRTVHVCRNDGTEEVVTDPPDPDFEIRWTAGECRSCTREALLPPEGAQTLPGCMLCDTSPPGALIPSHVGSAFCRSGSLASGGTNSHCTCDTCF